MTIDNEYGGWKRSADSWIAHQGEEGDVSRRTILDPALEAIIGSVDGLRVLDVGCGEGRYARKLGGRGAIVTGTDPVESFIDRAKRLHPDGIYVLGVAEDLSFPDRSFDMVLSYLSIIDIPDYRRAIHEMARVLKKSGRLIVVTISNLASASTDWFRDDSGRKLHRPVDRYMTEFAMDLEWSGIQIQNFHRPLSAILGAFFEEGFVLDGFVEPLPLPDTEYYSDECRAPFFQILTFRFG